jgi:hypothetical protein
MAFTSGQSMTGCPTAISVHNDGNVPGYVTLGFFFAFTGMELSHSQFVSLQKNDII